METIQEVIAVPVKKKRGFAAMSPEKRREISLLGAKKLHELGLAHTFTSDEAKVNGKIGGAISKRGKAVDPIDL